VSVNGTSGTVVKIARDGRLEIETDDHRVESVESGEVVYER
jgi:biotin-(acetyl-CoA carboxylase) ligase